MSLMIDSISRLEQELSCKNKMLDELSCNLTKLEAENKDLRQLVSKMHNKSNITSPVSEWIKSPDTITIQQENTPVSVIEQMNDRA